MFPLALHCKISVNTHVHPLPAAVDDGGTVILVLISNSEKHVLPHSLISKVTYSAPHQFPQLFLSPPSPTTTKYYDLAHDLCYLECNVWCGTLCIDRGNRAFLKLQSSVIAMLMMLAAHRGVYLPDTYFASIIPHHATHSCTCYFFSYDQWSLTATPKYFGDVRYPSKACRTSFP